MALSAPIAVASIGMADSLILMILALVVFGPRKLPQIGRQIGRLMYEFRKASNDFKFQMEEELRLAEDAERRQKEEAERQKMLADQAAVHAQPLPAPEAEPLVDPTVEAATVDLTAQSVPEPHYPRVADSASDGPVIQPPSTGETVAASAPASVQEAAAEPFEAAEPVEAAESAAAVAEPHQTSSTETVTQHG